MPRVLHSILLSRPRRASRHSWGHPAPEKQRVAIGRAILRGANILLLDEPFSALDAELRRNISEYLARAIAEFHVPMLFVSHDIETVKEIAHSTIRLAAVAG